MDKFIYTDHHVHTCYSPDSQANIEGYLLKAKDLGLSHLIFTDHIDMGAIEVEFQEHIDYGEYFQRMKELEEKHEIEIKVGVEIGYEKNHKNEIDEFLNRYSFEFVIASVHYGRGRDFYLGDFFHGKSQVESYMAYFQLVLEMVENFTNYEVVGHLDHIVRYGPFHNKSYEYREYREIIDSILRTLIKKGKGIEVNTSGLRSPFKTTYPKEEILKRYRELGGRIISIGSDAHFNEEYNKDLPEVIETLKDLGYKEISSFSKRKAKQKKIL